MEKETLKAKIREVRQAQVYCPDCRAEALQELEDRLVAALERLERAEEEGE